LAYLLEHRQGVAKERIYADLWGHSEADVPKMFHTRRGEIKSAFQSLGAHNPILYENGVYRLSLEEPVCDLDAFNQAVEAFTQESPPQKVQKVGALYIGRYLDDMEALWAESTRLRYEETFLLAVEVLMEHFVQTGEGL
jgi:two-component SAPR family response regulator